MYILVWPCEKRCVITYKHFERSFVQDRCVFQLIETQIFRAIVLRRGSGHENGGYTQELSGEWREYAVIACEVRQNCNKIGSSGSATDDESCLRVGLERSVVARNLAKRVIFGI
jgi:hypothetical protein